MEDSNLERMQGKPQNEVKHPPEYRGDLEHDPLAGQNIGGDPDREVGMRTAHDIKELSRELDLGDDELKRIHVLPEGERLQQGGTYLDLRDRGRGEITATGDMAAGRGNAYVAKDQVSYDTWNKLRGIDDPRRTT
ncbi:MAG TPA: hypothetical protein VHG91_21090 [Longimicrobium sp.]|nr:hypothetical protein [Longimicrobium sp.]